MRYEMIHQDAPCFQRLAFTWAAYGIVMAGLWQLAHGDPVAQALAWAVALLAGFGLGRKFWEV